MVKGSTRLGRLKILSSPFLAPLMGNKLRNSAGANLATKQTIARGYHAVSN